MATDNRPIGKQYRETYVAQGDPALDSEFFTHCWNRKRFQCGTLNCYGYLPNDGDQKSEL